MSAKECRLADENDGCECAVHSPAEEVTDVAEAPNGVSGGELGPGDLEEGAMVADGEEVIDGGDQKNEV